MKCNLLLITALLLLCAKGVETMPGKPIKPYQPPTGETNPSVPAWAQTVGSGNPPAWTNQTGTPPAWLQQPPKPSQPPASPNVPAWAQGPTGYQVFTPEYIQNQARIQQAKQQAAQQGNFTQAAYTPYQPTGSFTAAAGNTVRTPAGTAPAAKKIVKRPTVPAWLGPTTTQQIQGPTQQFGEPDMVQRKKPLGDGKYILVQGTNPQGMYPYINTMPAYLSGAIGTSPADMAGNGGGGNGGGGSGGFGTKYKGWGGSGSGYDSSNYPSWLMNLYSWNYKG